MWMMKSLTVKTETVTLIGKTPYDMLCVLSVCNYFCRVVLDLDKYIFPWQTCYFERSSYIRVILHLGKYGIVHIFLHFCFKIQFNMVLPSLPRSSK